jgi:carbonic anhydrase
MIRARKALQRLIDGNRRFVRGESAPKSVSPKELAGAQSPFAIVLGCSDSRVPAELVFDQGLGDLFVIRVAGNIVEPTQIGSVEFAAEQFGTRLVVVLGHSSCGAVAATLEQLERSDELRSPNLRSIVNWIRPSVERLLEEGIEDLGELEKRAVRANIQASVERLRHGSDILSALIRAQGLLIVGAEYDLETGVVDFFDGLPEVA